MLARQIAAAAGAIIALINPRARSPGHAEAPLAAMVHTRQVWLGRLFLDCMSLHK
jgi:hypothetical protein